MPPAADLPAAEAKARGQIAARAGRLLEAARHFRAALHRSPDDASVKVWLGQVLCAAGHLHEGSQTLSAGAAQLATGDPDAVGQALEVVHLLQRVGQPALAWPLSEQIANRLPSSPAAWHAMATCAAQIGQISVALDAARKLIRLTAGQAGPVVLLASIEIDARHSEAARDRLLALLAGPLSPLDALRARKELARAQDQLGAYDAVFPELAAAAALAPDVPEYAALDSGGIERLLTEDANAFSVPMLKRWREGGPADDCPPPVFVIGFLRSGTTLMQEILRLAPGAFVADEAPLLPATAAAFDRMTAGGGGRMARLDALDHGQRAVLRAHYRALAQARFGPAVTGKRLIDKFTLNVLDLPLILRLFPDAPILFLVRDPRDACVSAVLQLMPPTPATARLLDWAEAARFYALVTATWRRYRDVLELAESEVRYEALVGDFDATVHAALAHAGLEWNDAMREFNRSAAGRYIASPSRTQVAQPLNAGSIGRWRNYATAIEQVAEVLAPSLQAWDYDPA